MVDPVSSSLEHQTRRQSGEGRTRTTGTCENWTTRRTHENIKYKKNDMLINTNSEIHTASNASKARNQDQQTRRHTYAIPLEVRCGASSKLTPPPPFGCVPVGAPAARLSIGSPSPKPSNDSPSDSEEHCDFGASAWHERKFV